VGGDVSINNTGVPQCELCDLVEQLVGFTGAANFYNNQTDACPNNCD
jgi:hypothetical protein